MSYSLNFYNVSNNGTVATPRKAMEAKDVQGINPFEMLDKMDAQSAHLQALSDSSEPKPLQKMELEKAKQRLKLIGDLNNEIPSLPRASSKQEDPTLPKAILARQLEERIAMLEQRNDQLKGKLDTKPFKEGTTELGANAQKDDDYTTVGEHINMLHRIKNEEVKLSQLMKKPETTASQKQQMQEAKNRLKGVEAKMMTAIASLSSDESAS
jgi:hypothetical protein